MLSVYPACFFKEDSGSYSVIFPDLNHLSTCGDTAEEAMSMAVDCLAGHLYASRRDREIVPDPSPMKSVDIESIARDIYEGEMPEEAFVNMVSVDVEEYARKHFNKSVRKTLTIPAWLNAAAVEQGINFSQVLQEALMAKMQIK